MKQPSVQFVVANEETKHLAASADLMEVMESGEIPLIRAALPDFKRAVGEFDPITLLGVSGRYVFTWSLDASVSRKPDYTLEIADLEALQLLLLSSDQQGGRCVTPDRITDLWSGLRKQHFAAIEAESLDFLSDEKATLAERLRLHSAYYRNPYGREFAQRMMASITSEFDRGYDPAQRSTLFFQFIFSLLDEIDRRIFSFGDDVRALYKKGPNTARRIAQQYATKTKHSIAFYETIPWDTLPLESLRSACFNLIEVCASEIFAFTHAELIALSPRGDYDPAPQVNMCSCSFGDLESAIFESVSKGNPIWSRPFVKTEGRYFLFSPLTVLSFPFHLFLAAASGDANFVKRRLEDVRGGFVEVECEQLLKKNFPGAVVHRGLFWHDDLGNRYETDVIMKVGDRLVVFEAKGALLPDRVRAGNFVKAKSFLKDIYVLATGQAARLISEVKRSDGRGLQLKNQQGKVVIVLEQSAFSDTLAFSLTIEQLGTVANARALLEATEVMKKGPFSAPPIMLPELAKILESLPTDIHRLHYLTRRRQIYQTTEVVGDELDLFAIYVMHGFTSLPTGYLLSIVGASFHLPDHSSGKQVVFSKTSSVRNTAYFERLFRYVLVRQPAHYLDLAFAILDTPPGIQTQFERTMRDLRAQARSADLGDFPFCSIAIKEGPVSLLLAGCVYRDVEREARNIAIQNSLMEMMYNSMTRVGVLFGKELGFEKYPYSVALMLTSSRVLGSQDAASSSPDKPDAPA